MAKWFKMLCGLFLLPACVGAGRTLWRVLEETGRAESVWIPLASGAACWWVVYLMLPAPLRIYVFGHELTHVLWTWLFGGKVRRFKVSANGGQVIVTKTNFLIALSPYFFPLYAILVVLAFGVGHWIWGWNDDYIWLHLALGAAYSFHITLTWRALQNKQSDITSQGYLFSGAIIFLGNVTVLLVGLPLLIPGLSLQTSLSWWLEETTAVVGWLHNWVWQAQGWIRACQGWIVEAK